MENRLALIKIVNPHDLIHWEVAVRYIRSESEGPLFEQIQRDIQTISWVAGVDRPAELRSVMVFEVLSVRKCVEESLHLRPAPETFGDMLNVLAAIHGWNRSTYWIPEENDRDVKLLASRGVAGAGIDPAAFDPMKRLAMLVKKERHSIRLKNIRSQLRYMNSIRVSPHEQESQSDILQFETSPNSYLAFPIFAFDSMIGIVCCEAASDQSEAINKMEDSYLALLSLKLGETLLAVAAVPEQERESMFKQVVERAKLQWIKQADPFHSSLSARERQVAAHVAKGHTNTEIAKLLFVSPRTVTTHLERIYQKLNVNSRAALTRYVVEKGLLEEASD